MILKSSLYTINSVKAFHTLITRYSFCFLLFTFLTSCNWVELLSRDNKKKQEIFHSSPEEKLKPTIWDLGDTTICNEDRYDLFYEYIKELGGAYFGVGSIQNFSLAAWARSEWIWLMDFTRIVVAANKIHIAFLKEAKTPYEFRRLWAKDSKEAAFDIIQKEYGSQPDHEFIQKAWKVAGHFLRKRMKLLDFLTRKRQYKIWLNSIKDYNYLRSLALSNRIRSLRGDLTGNIAVRNIAQTAKKMQIVVRIAYFSNAEEYFKYYDDKDKLLRGYSNTFRESWRLMPFDAQSVILRTVSILKGKFPWPEDSNYSTDRGFHYNIMPAANFQRWLLNEGNNSLVKILNRRALFPKHGLSISF